MTTAESFPDWPRTAAPATGGVVRAAPEDFVVDEIQTIALSGSGEHVWLRVRKRGWNTDRVAQQIARAAGVARRDVGYAGIKDRHAITTQWFSVHLPGRDAPAWDGSLPQGIEVLESMRHARKLHTGALAGNRFAITLREAGGDPAAIMACVQRIRERGVPNYFGEQRFGHGGANVDRARALFAGRLETRDRHLRGIYLSAARAFLFNQVLARRVTDRSWQTGLPGEAWVLDGSHSFFVADDLDDALRARLSRGDIHPSGPLWGRGEPAPRAAALALEHDILSREPALTAGLAAAGLRQERRALRLFPREMQAEWLDTASLKLSFTLAAGSYATAVLRELADYRVMTALSEDG